jgi:hypothetical protein
MKAIVLEGGERLRAIMGQRHDLIAVLGPVSDHDPIVVYDQ